MLNVIPSNSEVPVKFTQIKFRLPNQHCSFNLTATPQIHIYGSFHLISPTKSYISLTICSVKILLKKIYELHLLSDSGLLQKVDGETSSRHSSSSRHAQLQELAKPGGVSVDTRLRVTERLHYRIHLQNASFQVTVWSLKHTTNC